MSSFSGLSDYQRCPNLYRYRNVLNLQPIERAVALFKGIGTHELLKVWFLALQKGATAAEAWVAVEDEYARLLDESKEVMFSDELAEAGKLLEEAFWLVTSYVEKYAHDWEILHVEETFTMTVDGVEISFTPDLVVRDRNGYVWIIDHKTTARLPEPGEIPFGDLQHVLYFAGLQPMYPELRGFIFSRMRKKVPTKPRLTKRSPIRVYDLNRIDTTYEVLRDFIMENAPALMKEKDHVRRLNELRTGEDRFFWEETIYVKQEEADEAVKTAWWTEMKIRDSEEADYYPRTLREDNGWGACSRCAFKSLCRAELLDWDASDVLANLYEQRPEKNPYKGIEE